MLSTERVSALWWRHATAIRWAVATVLLTLAGISTVLDEDSPPTQRATIAAIDITSGAIIKSSDLTTATDTLGLATLPVDRASGEIARGPIAAGEPITASRLSPGRSVDLPPDEVAFPLVLPDAHMSDLLVSGDHIDVFATRGPNEAAETAADPAARVVATDVEVLAVPDSDERDIGMNRDADTVVLVAASPAQAIALAGMKRAGSISIAIK